MLCNGIFARQRQAHHDHPRVKKLSTSFVAAAVLLPSLALLIAVGIWYLQGESQQSAAVVHLTQADWQDADGRSFRQPPASIDSNALPHRWQSAALPSVLPVTAQHPAASGGLPVRTTWLKMSLPARPALAGPLVLYGVRIKTDGTVAVYANGRLVHRAQQNGPLWNSLFTPLWVPLDETEGHAPLTEILIRVEHAPETAVGLSSLWMGPVDALRGRYYLRQWLQRELPATLSAAFMVVGIFAFFVWVRRSHETSYLLFFNLAAVSFVGHLHYYVSLPIVSDWFAWLTANALFWLLVVIHLFLRQLHGRRQRWLSLLLVGVTLASSVASLPFIAILPVYPSTSLLVPLMYAIAVLMGLVVSIVGGVSAHGRSREGLLLAAGVGLSTLLGMSDWLLYNNVINPEGWFLGAYTNAVTFAMFGQLMYRRYVNAITEVEQVNAGLAQRLQAREAELELSHKLLREAALRQSISDERQRLMQDMHDGLGSTLISAIRSVEHGGMNSAKVSQTLKDCLDDLKLMIDSMEPVDADLLLLLATLRFRLEPRLEGTDITLVWEVQELPPLDWLEPSSALHILRIVQESIANSLRHTRASRIRVHTAAGGDGITVTIEDNGQGFDVATALDSAAGRGLHNQQRRAQAIRGKVSWVSNSAGTSFTLWLPLERHA